MRIVVFRSGSEGNCTFVEMGGHKMLIDAGISCRSITGYLKQYGVNLAQIEAVLLTHIHHDHIKGLAQLMKTYVRLARRNLPLLSSANTAGNLWKLWDKKWLIEPYVFTQVDCPMRTPWQGEPTITPLRCCHDVACSGFLLGGEGEVVYITDTGCLEARYLQRLANKDFYIFESNHDIQMLRECRVYPEVLKARIASESGHLSNDYAARCLAKMVGSKTRRVVLAHISANTNTEDLALQANRSLLRSCGFNDKNVCCAHRRDKLEVIDDTGLGL